MYIDANDIITAAAVLSAIGVLGGVALAAYRFWARQKGQDRELAAIREELTLLCFSVRACLAGLEEQGCDGPVREARGRLDKHLNKAAHKGESNL